MLTKMPLLPDSATLDAVRLNSRSVTSARISGAEFQEFHRISGAGYEPPKLTRDPPGGGEAALASRSQLVTFKRGLNTRHRPHVFTEHGAAMLANVARIPVAVRASIQALRTLVYPRRRRRIRPRLRRNAQSAQLAASAGCRTSMPA